MSSDLEVILIKTMRILLLLTFSILITACQSGPNASEISQAVSQVISECSQVSSGICPEIPIDPDQNEQIGEVQIIDSENAKVIWQWEWGGQLRQKYEIAVTLNEEAWHPTEVILIEQVKRIEEVLDIEPEIEVRFDPHLLIDAAYVVQVGQKGKQLIVKEISGINEKAESENIVSETVTAEPTNWIVIKGQLTSQETRGDVTRLVRDYFKNYQGGNIAGLSVLAEEAVKYSYQAELYITDFEVTLPEDIKILGSEAEPKRADIEGQPISEPFSLQAQVPVKITYSLFGLSFNQDDILQLSWSPDNPSWSMPFWGITNATRLDESITLGENEIKLDGIATTHKETLVALTVSRNLPTTISIDGYGQQEQLLFKLPRAYKWIRKLPKPDQNELMITINSEGAPGKILTVDLNNKAATDEAASGVQGRVEWGPTCGNPSEADNCGNIPYQAELTITTPAGLVVANTTSDADGFFRIELAPNPYILIASEGQSEPYDPIKFTVQAGQLTYIPIIYPSMIE